MNIAVIEPDWPVAACVRAISTLRHGGVSASPYDSLNLADHVGDAPSAVTENRRLLAAAADLPAEPLWLEQVHGNVVVEHTRCDAVPQADAAISRRPGEVCAIMTADCLPVLISDRAGTTVAAAHAGWRGLARGILARTVAAMACQPDRLLAWLGPAISGPAYEVGGEVREELTRSVQGAASSFTRNARGRWQADLYGVARQALNDLGIRDVYGGDRCTFNESDCFFSHRRGAPCGRMATMIWIAS